jgi:hypothetical protein
MKGPHRPQTRYFSAPQLLVQDNPKVELTEPVERTMSVKKRKRDEDTKKYLEYWEDGRTRQTKKHKPPRRGSAPPRFRDVLLCLLNESDRVKKTLPHDMLGIICSYAFCDVGTVVVPNEAIVHEAMKFYIVSDLYYRNRGNTRGWMYRLEAIKSKAERLWKSSSAYGAGMINNYNVTFSFDSPAQRVEPPISQEKLFGEAHDWNPWGYVPWYSTASCQEGWLKNNESEANDLLYVRVF